MINSTTKNAVVAGHRAVAKEARLDAADAALGIDRFHGDGWKNVLSGMGTIKDKGRSSHFLESPAIQRRTLEAMYRSDGLTRRMIDMPIREMTRMGWETEGDDDGLLEKMFRQKGLNLKVREGLTYGDLIGGGLGVAIVDDGSPDLSKPLNRNRIVKVIGMQVFNRWQTVWSWTNAFVDPTQSSYLTPSMYSVIPITGGEFKVHASRCIRFEGVWVPDRIRVQNLGWGDPILQAIFPQLQMFAKVYNNGERITDAFVEEIVKVPGLENQIATDKGNKGFLDFMAKNDLMSSVYNVKVFDSLMDYEKVTSTVTGYADLMTKMAELLCAVRGVPMTKLLGVSPGGLNATGESDTRGWYDDLKGEQQDKMFKPIQFLNDLIVLSTEYKSAGGKVKEGANIDFRSLWQLTALDEAKRRLYIAQADKLNIDNGVTPGEIIESRFGGKHYSADTTLDPNIKPEDRTATRSAAAPTEDDPDGADDGGSGDKSKDEINPKADKKGGKK